jgi:hypothetical protein
VEATGRIDNAMRQQGIQDPEDHRIFDRVEFTFFHSEDEGSWFVDVNGTGRKAHPIRTHEELVRNGGDPRIRRWLFVPREVVDVVLAALR